MKHAIYVAGLALAMLTACGAGANTAENHYRSYCASCHGSDMSGGLGPPLVGYEWKHGGTDADLAQVIREGLPKSGMPPFGRMLSEQQIRALVIYMQERGHAARTQDRPQSVSSASVTIKAAGYEFTLQKVAEAPGELWAMDFLPDGTLVATQKDGPVWLFKDGQRLGPVEGTPEVWHRSQGGMLAVKPHPDYAKNGWLYLSYSHPGRRGAMTRVVRGQLDGLSWVKQETVYQADSKFYTDSGVHFGSRLVFHNGDLYFSIGDRGQQDLAQDLSHPQGKIHRLRDDGTVPDDNPFVGRKNALPSIWSYGHRNPQGLVVHPQTGAIWSAEHGPRGGDEINLVQKSLNYGWPVVTHGMNYNGTPITNKTHKEGMEPPKHHWTPSIAVSEIDVYSGDRFPGWRNHLLVGSLASQELRLVRLDGDRVVSDELLLQGLGRIRDVSDGPDGYPYVVFNNPNGMIYRLVPADKKPE